LVEKVPVTHNRKYTSFILTFHNTDILTNVTNLLIAINSPEPTTSYNFQN